MSELFQPAAFTTLVLYEEENGEIENKLRLFSFCQIVGMKRIFLNCIKNFEPFSVLIFN